MKIGLISGHGAGDCGAVGCGYQEADLTVELVKLLDEKLKEIGIETVVYPYERNAYKDCKNGGLYVDFSDCKYVLEVHFNACVNDQNGNDFVTGSEIWVTPREVGVTVEERILKDMETLGFTNRGVKKTDFLVINRVKDLGVSSALIETCFIDDLDDMRLYQAKRAEVAESIVKGIADGFGYDIPDTEDNAEGPEDNKSEADNDNSSVEESVKTRSESEFVEYIGKLAAEDMKKTGILASITAAQAILESGYGSSELAVNAHNLFGMKASLSGNTWASEWNGCIYSKETQEQNEDGSYETITADFRAYENEAQSIKDHSDYLTGAKNGSGLRYESLVGCTDYRAAAQIVKDGGYATSLTYVAKLCSIIERWNLTQYDIAGPSEDKHETSGNETEWYRVRKSWNDAASQLGAFHNLDYAKAMADDNQGYSVFDNDGNVVYGNSDISGGDIAVGDKVKVLKPVHYDNGSTFKLWYDVYEVIKVEGDRVVIGIGAVKTAPVDIQNLKKV